jgi:threonine dehydrogenase-like Zn-dependent dehydrogenase
MKAVVFENIGDIRLEEVKDPAIEEPSDVIVRLTASAICGTDLHMVRGTLGPMEAGTILGHEGVGVVEELGSKVRNFRKGDRVVITSTIACGNCVYCRAGYFAQCDRANPNGPQAGTAFFGGPAESGPFHGLQAEFARIPFAAINMVKLPDEVADDQAILLSDIFPTGYFGADLAEIEEGDVVVVFGCGPVGQFAIGSAKLMNAGRIIAVDTVASRLQMAQEQGAEVIDFNKEDPIEAIRELTDGIGADRAIDAVGVDAMAPQSGAGYKEAKKQKDQFKTELKQIAPKTNPQGENWKPGDAPSIVLDWAVKALDKAGTLAIIGVYPQTMMTFPIGAAMNKNLSVNAGNCNHRKYVPMLIDLVRTGVVDPTEFLTQMHGMESAIEAYKAFDRREAGWVKVELKPAA